MMKTLRQLRNLFFAICLLTVSGAFSQVGINTTTPGSGAMLDVTSSDKGILIPRVALSSATSSSPITPAPTTSLLVYNTATAGSGVTAVSPGFYYWSGTVWIPLLGNDWKLTGNSGTNPGVDPGENFLGTSDDNDMVIARFGIPHINLQTDHTLLNEEQRDIDLVVQTENSANSLFVDGANDNIGMGTDTPDNSAQLELADTDRGILVNRVALTATNVAAPVASPADGLLVYNTANSSSGSTEVLPGFYYWDSGRWVAMGGTNGRDWSLEGNAGTDPNINFVGTSDATDLVLRTSDTERLRILDAGMVGVGNAPYANVMLRVNDATNTQPFGIVAENSVGGGSSIYGVDYNSGVAVRGESAGTGLGVYGWSANSHGVYATTSYTGSAFLIGGIQAWGDGANGANGVLAVADKQASSRSNMGLRAVSGSTTSISTTDILNVGVNTNATDLALYAITEGPITTYGTMESARFQTNFTGNAITADSRDPRAQLAGFTDNSQQGPGSMFYGAYLYSGGSSSNSSFAYAGARYNNVNYKVIGNGTVSTIVEDNSGNKKVMFAPEAPEVLFEDYGVGQLTNGTANISIDPTFANNIVVDASHPLKVFIQLEGDCNGVFVTNKSASGFTVRELQNGTSNVSFSYHIVANRRSETANGETSDYSNLRFPDAPGHFAPETLKAEEIRKVEGLKPLNADSKK
jgi:hypothetical protein